VGDRELFRIAPIDVPNFKMLQQTAAEWKEAVPDDTSGSLSIALATCTKGPIPPTGNVFSVWLQTTKNEEPFLLIDEGDADKVLKWTNGNTTCSA